MEDSLKTTLDSYIEDRSVAIRAKGSSGCSSRGRPSPAAVRIFRSTVWSYYKKYGRVLPWRQTVDWYPILVSEIMLQQTQVDRVEKKYRDFLNRFPTPTVLARAKQSTVLKQWQGLGYNRRARGLQQSVQSILADYNGLLPDTADALEQLPGIGTYTASALLAFVYNQPVVLVETNVRTVMIHFFLATERELEDSMLLQIVGQTLVRRNARDWYYALMDLGAYLKSRGVRYNSRMKNYRRQAAFSGSNREVRGCIIRQLTGARELSIVQLAKSTDAAERQITKQRIGEAAKQLVSEGLVVQRGRFFYLAK
jgi:A/G-specific adenine glycosylase